MVFGLEMLYFTNEIMKQRVSGLGEEHRKLYKFFGYKPGTTEWDVVVEEGKGKGWQDKYNLLPFPFEQITANPNLKQNPGW